ncbi:MAG: hypothetical protein ACKVKO_11480, partial [Acidimicrobiales bacterium]
MSTPTILPVGVTAIGAETETINQFVEAAKIVDVGPVAACPAYSVESVFSAPNQDWDRDGLSNVNELYNQLDPCTANEAPALPKIQPLATGQADVSPAQAAAVESGEASGEVPPTNGTVETPQRTVPPTPECPVFTVDDVLANPNGDWDDDRASNLDEFYDNA